MNLGFDKEKMLGVAQRYILKGQSKKAVKELQKLVESSPTDSRLRLKLGDLYLKKGDHEEAFKEYLKVAELYQEEDLNVRAISIYKKILSINPNYIEALHRIAKLYLMEGLEGSAKNCYQTILKIKPDDSEAISALQKFDQNHPSRESLLRETPSREAPPREVATREPKRVAALSDLSLQEQDSPSDRTIVSERGTAETEPDFSSTGITAPALPSGEKEELPPPTQEAEMHYHLGIAYREMELFDYAITEFEMASEDLSMRFDCQIMLGTCYLERGDYDKSIDFFRKASQIKGLTNEKLARLHFNLGLAYEASGMISEALNTFKSVLKLDRSFADAQEKIEKLQAPSK
jgi:tetratricopeptide (TPR) repeat protein